MDNQCSPLLTWAYYSQGRSMDELRQSLLLTTLELETTRLKAQEELKMRDEQLNHLKSLLSEAIRERDEAQDKCHKLFLDQLLAPISGISRIEDEPKRGLDSNNGFSSSDCEESIISPPPPAIPFVSDKPLPEQGKLLQAVMKAGPLLQTLLLAGPLPEWRHPPPPLDSYQIPPPPPQLLHREPSLDTGSCEDKTNRKRVFCESSDSLNETSKYPRFVHH
ncbi:hypothetical protein ACSBR2_020720 [Camellia fascicularis]